MGSTGSLPTIGTEIVSSAVGASVGALVEYKLQGKNDDKKNKVYYFKDGCSIDTRPPQRNKIRNDEYYNDYIENNYY